MRKTVLPLALHSIVTAGRRAGVTRVNVRVGALSGVAGADRTARPGRKAGPSRRAEAGVEAGAGGIAGPGIGAGAGVGAGVVGGIEAGAGAGTTGGAVAQVVAGDTSLEVAPDLTAGVAGVTLVLAQLVLRPALTKWRLSGIYSVSLCRRMVLLGVSPPFHQDLTCHL